MRTALLTDYLRGYCCPDMQNTYIYKIYEIFMKGNLRIINCTKIHSTAAKVKT